MYSILAISAAASRSSAVTTAVSLSLHTTAWRSFSCSRDAESSLTRMSPSFARYPSGTTSTIDVEGPELARDFTSHRMSIFLELSTSPDSTTTWLNIPRSTRWRIGSTSALAVLAEKNHQAIPPMNSSAATMASTTRRVEPKRAVRWDLARRGVDVVMGPSQRLGGTVGTGWARRASSASWTQREKSRRLDSGWLDFFILARHLLLVTPFLAY